jgi:FecR protein/Tetratricopeptide repeat
MSELRNLARSLPSEPARATEQEEVRTALLLRSVPSRRTRLPRAPWVLIPLAAGVAAALALGPGARRMTTTAPASEAHALAVVPKPEVRRARVHSDDGATFVLEHGQPDEIVRLRHGSIVVDVEPLHPGERFRVVMGDSEIEVRGTVFHVVARADRLEHVDVWRGRVVVRSHDVGAIELGPGGRWEIRAPENVSAPLRPKRATAARASTSHLPPSAAPSLAEADFGDGWRALRAERFADAAAAFERAAAAAGDQPLAEDASFWRAVCQGRMGDPTAASASLTAFIDRFPRSPRVGEASAMLGWVLIDQNDLDGAARLFTVAASDRVSNVRQSARSGLAKIERLRGQATRGSRSNGQ